MQDEESKRPWGYYEILSDRDDHKVKRITVNPGKRLSLQSHARRAEHWFVVKGSGQVTIDDNLIDVNGGVAVDIDRGARHRVENTGPDELCFIEVQIGNTPLLRHQAAEKNLYFSLRKTPDLTLSGRSRFLVHA